MRSEDRFGGLSKVSAALLIATILIGLAHHTDHVLRVDHINPSINIFAFVVDGVGPK